jgi:3-hydroxyisobutyrate dehydrogenase-like beta-hydroxyacid dehydrogenase
MGAALAHALHQAGHHITVWNRTTEKMQPFVTAGARGASCIAEAVQASPVILICIDNYDTTRRILGTDDVVPHLAGRVLIQLSTGTPREARESEAWMTALGGGYLDGAILGGPRSIGTQNAHILVAGAEATCEQCEPLLTCLGGNLRYLGENVGAASALDLAWLCERYGMFLGVVHGARLCESEQVSVDLYASLFPAGDRARRVAQIIHAGAYGNPGATLSVWEGALQKVQSQAHDAEINGEIPDFVSGIFKRAIEAGHGEEDVAALIKVLRRDSGA